MSNRRDFLKTAAFAALGSGMAINHVFAGGNDAPSLFNVNSRAGVTPKMKLRFFPYELKLRHVFTVATYSRTTTPDVQVEIEYDGIIGYGEASMPPYLQHELGTMDSVLAFLKKVQDVIGQFSDPFQLEDILAYIDSMCPARKLVHKFNTGPTLRASQKDSIKVKLIQTVFHASVGGIAHECKIHTCFDDIVRE